MFESLMMFVGGYEWVWIVVIVGVLLFGAKKIPEQQQTPTVQQSLDLALQHHTAGRLPEAEGLYQQVLQADPNQPAAARCKAERPKLKSIGGIQIACHGIEEGRFDATIEMTAQTVSG